MRIPIQRSSFETCCSLCVCSKIKYSSTTSFSLYNFTENLNSTFQYNCLNKKGRKIVRNCERKVWNIYSHNSFWFSLTFGFVPFFPVDWRIKTRNGVSLLRNRGGGISWQRFSFVIVEIIACRYISRKMLMLTPLV